MIKKKAPSLAKKAKPKKARPKATPRQGLSNAELRELMKTSKPPQSWYTEDHTGLY
jgi:hypothetical protein